MTTTLCEAKRLTSLCSADALSYTYSSIFAFDVRPGAEHITIWGSQEWIDKKHDFHKHMRKVLGLYMTCATEETPLVDTRIIMQLLVALYIVGDPASFLLVTSFAHCFSARRATFQTTTQQVSEQWSKELHE